MYQSDQKAHVLQGLAKVEESSKNLQNQQKNHQKITFFGDFSNFPQVWLKTSNKMGNSCDS
jgi:hypothetical protein